MAKINTITDNDTSHYMQYNDVTNEAVRLIMECAAMINYNIHVHRISTNDHYVGYAMYAESTPEMLAHITISALLNIFKNKK